MTRDLNECSGRYRKRGSLRSMKQERNFWLKAEIFVISVGFLNYCRTKDVCFRTGSKDKDAPV